MARAKRKLPAKPAAFISPQHRSHFCRRHPIPEHKAPAADDNTHPTKTSRPDQTAPTDARTQKTRCRRQYTPHKNLTARSNGTDRYPNTKKTRCRSEHRRPFPLSLKKPQRCLNAIVQRQPPPAGAQHHLTQPNPNISGRRFTAFFALRCL